MTNPKMTESEKKQQWYRDNLNVLKQALTTMAIFLRFPNDPNIMEEERELVQANFQEFITLEFHLSVAYWCKDNMANAVLYAECAKNDFLAMPGMTENNPRMLPYYRLLRSTYHKYAKLNEERGNLSLFAKNSRLREKYAQAMQKIKDEYEIVNDVEMYPYPVLPQLAAARYGEPYTVGVDEEMHDKTRRDRFNLQCELLDVYEKQAIALLDQTFDVFTFDWESLSRLHWNYARQFFAATNYKEAIIHGKRAEAIALFLVNYDHDNAFMLPYYNTLHEIFECLQKAMPNDDLFPIDAANYNEKVRNIANGTQSMTGTDGTSTTATNSRSSSRCSMTG